MKERFMICAAIVVVLPVLALTSTARAQRPQLTVGQAPKSQPASSDRLTDLEAQIKRLQSRVNELSNRTAYNFASLDCNSKRYIEFRFLDSHFVFLVSCQSIEPYLEGHRVIIKVGNPYSFNFSNVKGRLQYGKTMTEAMNQEADISTAEPLRGGSWQTLVVVVNPSKPEDMRELWLELKAETAGATR